MIIANTPLAHLAIKIKYAEAPIVLVHWLDASFDSQERIVGENPPGDYVAGCMDVVMGYFLGVQDGCVILGHSAYVRVNEKTSYRHIWNIPEGMIVKIEPLIRTGQVIEGVATSDVDMDIIKPGMSEEDKAAAWEAVVKVSG